MGLQFPPAATLPMLPPDTFKGRVALITGGASGVGQGMALGLARCGATIVIMSRNPDNLGNGLEVLRAAGATAIAVSADVRDRAQVAAAFEQAENQVGPISILLNNAGANFPILAENMSVNGWRSILQIALDGTFHCCQEFHKRRLARNEPGVILNNSATYAWSGFPGDAHAAAAKAATLNLTMTLATEWAPDGIRVNTIVPGFYPHEKIRDDDNVLGSVTPADRCGQMPELGWAAAYLCSPYANFITGMHYVVDGAEMWRRGPLMPEFIAPRNRANLW